LSLYYISDDSSSSFGEEIERESISDGNSHRSYINKEEEEENWDLADEASDNFDPNCKFVFEWLFVCSSHSTV
jgi:hypothetical protein